MISNNTLIQVPNYGMGTGDDELGRQLILNYFKLLLEEDNVPAIVTFYNSGVKLLVDGSPIIDELKILQERGTKLLACRTCLNHFDIANKMLVGIEGTMMDIITLQMHAQKVINL